MRGKAGKTKIRFTTSHNIQDSVKPKRKVIKITPQKRKNKQTKDPQKPKPKNQKRTNCKERQARNMVDRNNL